MTELLRVSRFTLYFSLVKVTNDLTWHQEQDRFNVKPHIGR